MQLQHIDLNDLKTTKLNVRKQGAKNSSDLVPSIRSLGIIQPLLVRPNCEGYEVVAGQRRFHALHTLAKEGEVDPVPCIVMNKGDDAKAIEASLAENIARLPMDEIDQFKAFLALSKQGQSLADIASQFGITERLVKQRLAIANLIAPLLTAYQQDKIHAQTLRLLTMASKAQQKAWLALFNSDDEHAPEGYQLKSWLFGGANIPTQHALFEVSDYDGAIITDLFGEDSYFDDAKQFWLLQDQAIAEIRDQYLADGWTDVVILDRGEYFPSYDYVDTAKDQGGKVYIASRQNGEVTCYEGQLSRKDIKAKEKKETSDEEVKPAKPELTKAMQNYLDLHRHSAVRYELLNHQSLALRLAVAQILCGSALWAVNADPQKADNEVIENSLTDSKTEIAFAQQRAEIQSLLGLDADDTLVAGKKDWQKTQDLHPILSKLIALDDKAVMRIFTLIVAETLPCGGLVEVVGNQLNTDMRDHWQADPTFIDLLRDKQAINALLKEVAGKAVADARVTTTAKEQKAVIAQYVDGSRPITKKNWQPRYMDFPMRGYTQQGGIRAIEHWKAVKKLYR